MSIHTLIHMSAQMSKERSGDGDALAGESVVLPKRHLHRHIHPDQVPASQLPRGRRVPYDGYSKIRARRIIEHLAYMHGYRRVYRHVYRHDMDVCLDMCIGMCMNTCTDVCTDMCIDMCADMCIGMS